MGFCGRFDLGPLSGSYLSPCFIQLIAIVVNSLGALCLLPRLKELLSGSYDRSHKWLEMEYTAVAVADQTDDELAAERTDQSYRVLSRRAAREKFVLEGRWLHGGALGLCGGMLALRCVASAPGLADTGESYQATQVAACTAVGAWAACLAVVALELRGRIGRCKRVLWFWVLQALVESASAGHWHSSWIQLSLLTLSVYSVLVAGAHMLRHSRSGLADLKTTVWMLLRRPDDSHILRLLRLGAKDVALVGMGLGGFTVHAMCRLWVSVLFGRLIDDIYSGADTDRVLAEFAIATVAMGGFDCVGGTCLDVAGARLGTRLQRCTFDTIVEQDLLYFETRKTGKLMTVLSSNVSDVKSCLTYQLADTFEGVVTSLVLLCYMFAKSPRLAAVFVGCTLLPLGLATLEGKLAEGYTQQEKECEAEQGQVAQEHLSSMHTVKSFGMEEKSKLAYAAAVAQTYSIRLKTAVVEGVLQGLSETGFYSVIVICLYYGASDAESDEAGRAFFVSFMIIANQAIDNLQKTFETVPEFARALGSVHKILQVFDHNSLMPYRGGLAPLELTGRIELQNVSFSYPSRPERVVLEHVDLAIEPGAHVALVGPSGCGKSSLISLVSRLWDPTSGVVLLDGRPATSLDPQWLHQQLAVVLQEPTLFSGTVRENIVFGVPGECSQEKVLGAARHAYAHDFIMGLPDGYDTLLGERGVSISGGQKQRIAIARALIREPSVLLLDEATSALDSESELEVQQALGVVMQGRTMLVSAHRLSTIAQCELVAVFEQGKLADLGSHAELVARGGRYAGWITGEGSTGQADGPSEAEVQAVAVMLQSHMEQSGEGFEGLEVAVKRALEVLRPQEPGEGKEDAGPGSSSSDGSSSGGSSSDESEDE